MASDENEKMSMHISIVAWTEEQLVWMAEV